MRSTVFNQQHTALVLAAIPMLCLLAGTAGAGEWYAGDLHSHSLHSDGDSPVAEVLASATARGLDFFALTDHDSYMDGRPTHWLDPDYVSDTLVLLYGIEWTSAGGHANAWKAEPWDYAAMWQANLDLDAAAAAEAARAAGALFSVNHPARPPLHWQYAVPAAADCVEVWNGPMLINSNFSAAHDFWDDLLLARRRINGVGGSDTHHLHDWMAPFTGHGQPTTWVYADEFTAEGILAGIAAGHAAISYAPWGPRLTFTADVAADGTTDAMMGDSVAGAGEPIAFDIRIAGAPAGPGDIVEIPDFVLDSMNRGRLRLSDRLWALIALDRMETTANLQFLGVIKDGDWHRAWFVAGSGAQVAFFDIPAAGAQTYYRVELFGATEVEGLINRLIYGHRTALTNPIYVNY